MDKKSLLAMLLIAIILITMPYYQEYFLGVKPGVPIPAKQENREIESLPEEEIVVPEIAKEEEFIIPQSEKIIGDSAEKILEIETENYIIKLSNRGGGSLKSFILKKYTKYDSSYVNMISDELDNNLTLSFQETSGKYIDSKDFLFKSSNIFDKILSENEEYKVVYFLDYDGTEIRKEFVFYSSDYHIDLKVSFSNSSLLLNNNYQINWINGLPSTESYIEDDSNYGQAFAYMAGDVVDFTIDDPGRTELLTLSGKADWLAVRTKYFISSISVLEAEVSEGVYFQGLGIQHENYLQRLFDMGFFVQYEGKPDFFRLYIGPLDHNELGNYDNNLDELIMNNGSYERFFRPFSRYIIMPLLEFFHSFIPNWGLVIVVFTIFIKIVLYPATKKSYQSTKKMQVLQPKMQEIREKYKNDQQRLNKEMMELYKTHGSPLSGCLPMLLQMPLLFALFIVFRSTIQLRGASFIPGWIDDLSQTDTIFTMPFSIPLYGNDFNLLPLIMALTMFFQTKMTMTDPKQKAIVYIMPVFMLFLFNSFPSGLNLYYSLFNILTILQQKFIKSDKAEVKKEPVKKPKKKR
jgi:YidC/Oxa1 family membrane protein insertase